MLGKVEVRRDTAAGGVLYVEGDHADMIFRGDPRTLVNAPTCQ